jgi:hypothetical protein
VSGHGAAHADAVRTDANFQKLAGILGGLRWDDQYA